MRTFDTTHSSNSNSNLANMIVNESKIWTKFQNLVDINRCLTDENHSNFVSSYSLLSKHFKENKERKYEMDFERFFSGVGHIKKYLAPVF